MRKRTSLDTTEANFVFTKILLKINRDERLKNLPIPVKNKLIDEVGLASIKEVHSNDEDVEAIYFEFTSYKLPDEERAKSLSPEVYIKKERPKGYNEYLKTLYSDIIDKKLSEFGSKLKYD
jgi:hypothetical protein